MSNETGKAVLRRIHDSRFINKYFVGNGIDIGAGIDGLGNYCYFFPLMAYVKPWDVEDGDAQYMQGVRNNYYDFVHSSHCLEHMVDPYVALENWIRICKSGGYIVLLVPDEDLYEQGEWPSTFNPDHKSSFTINKAKSWSPASVNVFDLLGKFDSQIKVIKLELLDETFIYNQPRVDQSRSFSESAIEIILQKL